MADGRERVRSVLDTDRDYDCARGRHCTVSAGASRRHVDAFLDLFTRESPRTSHLERFIREESSQRAPPFLCGWWEYKLD
jgi:hypothetical protein